jgi:hypothetical protein
LFADFIECKHFASACCFGDLPRLDLLGLEVGYLFLHIYLASSGFSRTYFSFACLCSIPFESYFVMKFFTVRNCCPDNSNSKESLSYFIRQPS